MKIHCCYKGFDPKEFQNELKNMAMVQHENVVQLVGYCNSDGEEIAEYKGRTIIVEKTRQALCLEYLLKGSLDKYISGTWHYNNQQIIIFL